GRAPPRSRARTRAVPPRAAGARASPCSMYTSSGNRDEEAWHVSDHDPLGAGRSGRARTPRSAEPGRDARDCRSREGARNDRAPLLRIRRTDPGRGRVARPGELPALLRLDALRDRLADARGRRDLRAGDQLLAQAGDARRSRLGLMMASPRRLRRVIAWTPG